MGVVTLKQRVARFVFACTVIGAGSVVTGTSVAIATGNTLYVSATGAVGTGQSCASPGYVGANETSIQAAINAASSGDTVYVCAGTYDISPRLTITKNLTFQGAGEQLTILDGGTTSQILYLPDQNPDITISISDFTFQNGGANTRNGGECNLGANCGGAIFVGGGTRFHVADSLFTGNQAMFGGAIAVSGAGETVASTISRSTFQENRTTIDGGAVLTLSNNGLVMDRITMVGNKIVSGQNPRDGAALVVNFGSATLKNSSLVNNSVTTANMANYSTSIYVNGSLTINNSILANQSGIPLCKNAYNTSLAGMATGNLVTDNSCTVTQAYPPATTGQSSKVSYADLQLGTLSYRGYDSKTVPLLTGSVALNYHSNSCSGNDQVGTAVPEGARCDVGAYERPAAQSLNTPSGWTYPSNGIDRGYSNSMSVSSAASDPAGRGVTYASSTSSVCSISPSGTITAIANGTCTVTATGPAWLTRDEDSVTKTITVTETPANQTTTTTSSTSTTSTTVASPPTSSTTSGSNASSTATTSSVAAGTSTEVIALNSVTTSSVARRTDNGADSTRDAQTAVAVPTTTPTTTPVADGPAAPDAPSAAPGESSATVDGESVVSTLSRLDNSLVIAGGGINATIYGVTADGARIPLNADGSLQLNEGDSIAVDASGYDSGQEVEVWMFSTPTVLGSLTADTSGQISGKFALPSTLAGGNHRLVLRGPNSNGAEVVVSLGLLFGEINSGFSVNRWVIIIPLALAIGAGLIIPTSVRRRRREAVSVG